MDRVILVLLAVALGGGAGYLIADYFGEKPVIFSTFEVREPESRNEIITTRIVSSGSAVVMYPRKNINNTANHAAMMNSWTIRANIGVDFTDPDWKENIDGLGKTVEGSGTVKISGTLPPLEVLDKGFQHVEDLKEPFLINAISSFDEDEVLKPKLLELQQKQAACLEDYALYRIETLTHAKEVVISWFEAAQPRREDGTPIATFDLHFENEDELTKRISELKDQPLACESSLMLNEQDL